MQNIGERLEEARKRKGISIREAAEATKIRGDFLAAFENGSFDIPLPDIYRRGFLKLYANYLKLDGEQIMTDYNAYLLGNSRVARAGGREVFGRMDAEDEPAAGRRPSMAERFTRSFRSEESDGAPRQSRAQQSKAPKAPKVSKPPRPEPSEADEYPEEDRKDPIDLSDKTIFVKVGLVIAGASVALILIVLLVQALAGGGNRATPPAAVTPPSTIDTSPNQPPPETGANNQDGDFTLIAKGNVYYRIYEADSETIIQQGSMSQGEELTLEPEGEVDIRFYPAQNIRILPPSGRPIDPEGSGSGRILSSMW